MQSGESALKWAQDGSKQSVSVGGDWSWKKIRDFYYSALTAKNDTDRQANFAQTFRGLGHQMHLMQDMSVPAHVRNDAHPEDSLLEFNRLTGDYYFESWAKKYYWKINPYAATPVFPSVDLNIARNGLSPISQFIDSEQYSGSVPLSSSLTWGLSEYTNLNFMSDDTIFTENFSSGDRHYFPYPRYVGQNQCYEQYEEPYGFEKKKRTYWRKKCVGEPVDHFVTVGPFFKRLPYWDLQRLDLRLDEATHNDYAALLIPRAVGYSAGLLNYFFRGDMESVNAATIKDNSGNITGAKLKVKNKTPNENMGPGKFALSYQFKPSGSNEFVYGTSAEVAVNETIPPGAEFSNEITFTFGNQIPIDAQEVKYFLIYRGNLGKEEDAVAAKMTKLGGARGGIVQGVDRNSVSIAVLNEMEAKTYKATISSNETIIKAAFDEGSVDVVRVLSMTTSGDQRIWYVDTFVYDRNVDRYQEKSKTEVARANFSSGPNNVEFNFTQEWTGESFHETIAYKGIVSEYPGDSFTVTDFFVPAGQAPKYMKLENRGLGIAEPFPTRSQRDRTETFTNRGYKYCSATISEIEEYLDGPFDSPNCRRRGTQTYQDPTCGQDAAWDISGYCYADDVWAVEIQYFPWQYCDGSGVSYSDHSVWLWISASLNYDAFSKTINNPKYNGGSKTWMVGPNGPCLLFGNDAEYVSGTLSGRILSDNQVVVRSDLRQGYDVIEKGIVIEPGGVTLESWPYLMLRQTGGYSMFEYLGNGAIRNHTSFSDVPLDKPILLNKKGDGFKISFTPYFGRMYTKFQVGTKYDAKVMDFTAISQKDYTVQPELVMDIMVEYN